MDAKLKALKVVDLKAILAKAHVTVPAKANKQDLIARIISSEPALAVYNGLHPPTDDLLAPPEDVDWTDQGSPEPKHPPTHKQVPAREPAVTPATDSVAATTPVAEDPEAEKRRQRAARFGIPVIEPRSVAASRTTSNENGAPIKAPAPDDLDREKLKSRAARFGTVPTGQKRAAPAEQVDAEEAERRRKRAERFGIPHVDAKA